MKSNERSQMPNKNHQEFVTYLAQIPHISRKNANYIKTKRLQTFVKSLKQNENC